MGKHSRAGPRVPKSRIPQEARYSEMSMWLGLGLEHEETAGSQVHSPVLAGHALAGQVCSPVLIGHALAGWARRRSHLLVQIEAMLCIVR